MKKVTNIAFLIFLSIALWSFSYVHEVQTTPYRIVLSIQEDPSTQIGISWQTKSETKQALVQLAVENSTPDLKEIAKTYTADSYSWNNGDSEVFTHQIVINDLVPSTVYTYRVGDGKNWSEWNTLETVNADDSKLSFVYFGDVQYGFDTVWGRVLRQSLKRCPNPAFFLYAGDLITTAGVDSEWKLFFDAGDWVFRTFPIMATPGNHEHYKVNDEYDNIAPHWDANFCFANNGPEGLENTVYYSDVKNVRFISLNTTNLLTPGVDIAKQIDWFESVLEDNTNRWTVVTMHHPIHNLKSGRDDNPIQDYLQSIFEEYGVDLVLQGHDHAYGRLIDKDKKSHKYVGPAYVVSSAGAKMYGFNFSNWADRLATNTQLYQVIDIDGDELVFSAYLVDGELFDQFKLQKKKDGSNVLKMDFPRQIETRMDLGKRAKRNMTEENMKAYEERITKFFEENR